MCFKKIIIILALGTPVLVSLANEPGQSVTNQPVQPDKASTAWNYKSDEYGFSITLPDSGWVKKPSSIHGAVGFLKKGFAMRTDIFIVPCDSEFSFQGLAERVKREIDVNQTISDVHHESGKTESGHSFQFSVGTEKVQKAPRGVYIAESVVWIEDKKIALRVCFQGESLNVSTSIRGVAPKDLEISARTICLSVK